MMINGDNNYNNEFEYVADLNELFQKTFEFDILTYVTRGIIKNQQTYEDKLIEIKLENLKTQKEIALLYEEINKLKNNNINIKENPEEKEKNEYQQKKDEIEANIQKLINEKEKINNYNQNLTNINTQYYEENIDNQVNKNKEEIKEYKEQNNENIENTNITNIDNIDNKISKKEIIENGKNIDINISNENQINDKINDKKNQKIDNINTNTTENIKKIDDNKINKRQSINQNISESINHQKELTTSFNKRNYMFNQINYKSRINSAQLENEFKNLKTKISDIENIINQFKLKNDSLLESNKNYQENISNELITIKEENEKKFNLFNDNFNEKINSVNDIIKKLKETNEENEKLINMTKTQNNTLMGKMDIINAKFIDQVSKTDFEKYKNAMYDKIENDNKGVNIDLSLIKKSVSGVKTQLLEITNDQTDHFNLEKLIQRFDSANIIINKLQDFHKDYLEREKRKLNLDPAKLVDIDQFSEFQKNQNKINEKNKREIIDINRDINDIKNFELVTKASYKDLKNLEDKVLLKIEELLTTVKEKFLEKKSLQKYTKLIEYQTKQSLEEFKANLKPGINWLMAKKPMGHLCASCEAYLGDLNSNTDKYIHWNKYSSKESSENKINKVDGGFSKIMQLINNYDEKDISKTFIKMNQRQNNETYTTKHLRKNQENDEQNNINNKKTASNSANYSNIYGNVSKSNINNSSNISKNNIENNNSFQIEEYESEMIGSLPRIKKKTFSASNIPNSDELLFQKHSFSMARATKGNNNSGSNNDFIIMTKNDQDKRKKDSDLGSPKITKILKKINKNRDSVNTLNNEIKKNNDNK